MVLLSAVMLLAAGCSSLDPELVADWSGDTERSLLADGVEEGVVSCVLDVAGDDLERGALSEEVLDELVRSCRIARVATEQRTEDLIPDVELALTEVAWTFGDDPELDQLWVECEQGDGGACDELFEKSPVGSLYEDFGVSCGNRPDVLHCSELGAEE